MAIPKYIHILKRKPTIGDWIVPNGSGWIVNVTADELYKPVRVKDVYYRFKGRKNGSLRLVYQREDAPASWFVVIDKEKTRANKIKARVGLTYWGR